MKRFPILLCLLFLFNTTLARCTAPSHSTNPTLLTYTDRWTALIVNNTRSADYFYVRESTNHNRPLTSPTTPSLRCNEGGATSGRFTHTAPITAGSTLGFALDTTLHTLGPILVYLSRVPQNTTASFYDGSGSWFKIAETGPSEPIFKAGEAGVKWDKTAVSEYMFTIPPTLPRGEYLVRVEHVALQYAREVGGARFFVGCAQVEVVDGGFGVPGPLVRFPGAYGEGDEGIRFDMYKRQRRYVMPGPPVWNG